MSDLPPTDIPIDISVPVRADDTTIGHWQARAAAGSSACGYAIGVYYSQRGELVSARRAWEAAEVLGSAEATCGLALLHASEGDDAAFRAAVRRSDEGGSMLAAMLAAQLAGGDDDGAAAAAMVRMRERAEPLDAAGSADAALLLGVLAQQTGDDAEAIAALGRAHERGSVAGSTALAVALIQAGDLAAAEPIAVHLEDQGYAIGSYLLASVYVQTGRKRQSVAAGARAVAVAGATGDAVTLRLATRLFRPFGAAWWRAHRLFAAGLGVGVVLLGIFADWRWSVTAFALIAAFMIGATPVMPGMAQDFPEDESRGLSFAGLSAVATFTDPTPLNDRNESSPVRLATRRDSRLWSAITGCLTVVALISVAWAARWLSDSAMTRVAFGAAAVASFLALVWQWPHFADRNEPPAREREGVLTIRLSFAPRFFYKGHFTLRIGSPLLTGLAYQAHQSAARRRPLPAVAVRLLSSGPSVTATAVFAALALAPDPSLSRSCETPGYRIL
jgi:hypothetical protein